jgi:basic membrane protein A
MTVAEAESEYLKALRLGQKECAMLQGKGQNPFPLVLDQILGGGVSEGAQDIGTLEIPIERIVGVKSAGRISAFSAGFFPLLDCESEFARKWMVLCQAHQGDEGIRDPIICYEYLGNFYVQEGNKRLSVLKYYGATRIPGVVYRIVPPLSQGVEIRAYYEFLEFFKYAKLYDVRYTHPGYYMQLLALTNLPKDRPWTEDERRRFRAYFQYFRDAFDALGGRGLHIQPEEALLLWLQVHPFSDLGALSGSQLKKSLSELWENVVAMDLPDLVVRTEAAETAPKQSLFGRLRRPGHVNVAFVHQRTVETSPWTCAHDVGRRHLEDALGNAVTVRSYFGADTAVQAEAPSPTARR